MSFGIMFSVQLSYQWAAKYFCGIQQSAIHLKRAALDFVLCYSTFLMFFIDYSRTVTRQSHFFYIYYDAVCIYVCHFYVTRQLRTTFRPKGE